MSETSYDCPTCRRRQPFEQPPCAEGHGADCPDWVCLVCGTALFADTTADADVELIRTRVA